MGVRPATGRLESRAGSGPGAKAVGQPLYRGLTARLPKPRCVKQGYIGRAVQEALGLPGRPSVEARVDALLAELARQLGPESGAPRDLAGRH